MSLNKWIIGAVAIVCFVAAAQCHPGALSDGEHAKTGVPKIFDYSKYIDSFRKNYGHSETLNKAKIFFGRTLKIFQHNVLFKSRKVNYFLTQNEFTDMTADELKQLHASSDSDLEPVSEAQRHPDMPASQALSVQKLNGAEDGFSSASLEALASNAKYDADSQRVKPVLNFMQDDQVADLKLVLHELKSMPELAEKVAKVIEISGDSDASSTPEVVDSDVKYKKVVESDNANYDPELVTSYGFISDLMTRPVEQNYGSLVMDDAWGFNVVPYDMASPPEGKVLKGDASETASSDSNESVLGSLVSSVKGIYELLTSPDEDLLYDKKDDAKQQQEAAKKAKSNEITWAVDWRTTGCITAPKNQMSCNSCYAFTTLSLLEFFYCRQTKQLTDFSAQYVVDCGPKAQLHGCQGGKLTNVGQFIKKHGIELNSMYPYLGKQDTCRYDENDERAHKPGYLRPDITHWHRFTDMASWYKWHKRSPLIVGISMPADFLAYGGGVHDGLDCVPEMTHAMLLVGSGVQDGREFWLLKNSYSDKWGEKGYFRLSKDAPLRCFDSAIVARAKFGENAQEQDA